MCLLQYLVNAELLCICVIYIYIYQVVDVDEEEECGERLG